MANYQFRVNGSARAAESSDPDQPLLYILRAMGLTATKFGCGGNIFRWRSLFFSAGRATTGTVGRA